MDKCPMGWPLLYKTPLGMFCLYGKVMVGTCSSLALTEPPNTDAGPRAREPDRRGGGGAPAGALLCGVGAPAHAGGRVDGHDGHAVAA